MTSQLDKRVAKIEAAVGQRQPRLVGRSPQACLDLLIETDRSEPDRIDLVLQGMSEEQLDGVINICRAREGLPPEPPPLGKCTMQQIREHYPDFYKSWEKLTRTQRESLPDAEIYDHG